MHFITVRVRRHRQKEKKMMNATEFDLDLLTSSEQSNDILADILYSGKEVY